MINPFYGDVELPPFEDFDVHFQKSLNNIVAEADMSTSEQELRFEEQIGSDVAGARSTNEQDANLRSAPSNSQGDNDTREIANTDIPVRCSYVSRAVGSDNDNPAARSKRLLDAAMKVFDMKATSNSEEQQEEVSSSGESAEDNDDISGDDDTNNNDDDEDAPCPSF